MTTHNSECYKWHHKCAIAEIERLRKNLENKDEELSTLVEMLSDCLETSKPLFTEVS